MQKERRALDLCEVYNSEGKVVCVRNFMTRGDVRLQSHLSGLDTRVTRGEFRVPKSVNFLLFADRLSCRVRARLKNNYENKGSCSELKGRTVSARLDFAHSENGSHKSLSQMNF